jgi:ferredoxin--NADP+ reductase
MRLEDFDTGENYQARVVSNRRLNPDSAVEEVREIVLEMEHPEFDYRLGQSVGVIVDGPFDADALNRLDSRELALQHPHHFRLYTIADTPDRSNPARPKIKLCVRRCHYIDDYSGESYPGIASNYLCDLGSGELVTVNGPFGQPWELPDDRSTELLLIGMGTGIAPFRALVRHIYEELGGWQGKIFLLNLARSGPDLLYMNDTLDEFARYRQLATFTVASAVSPRPRWGDPADLAEVLQNNGQELLAVLKGRQGYVLVAGQEVTAKELDDFIAAALTDIEWGALKQTLREGGRWQELLY